MDTSEYSITRVQGCRVQGNRSSIIRSSYYSPRTGQISKINRCFRIMIRNIEHISSLSKTKETTASTDSESKIKRT